MMLALFLRLLNDARRALECRDFDTCSASKEPRHTKRQSATGGYAHKSSECVTNGELNDMLQGYYPINENLHTICRECSRLGVKASATHCPSRLTPCSK